MSTRSENEYFVKNNPPKVAFKDLKSQFYQVSPKYFYILKAMDATNMIYSYSYSLYIQCINFESA